MCPPVFATWKDELEVRTFMYRVIHRENSAPPRVEGGGLCASLHRLAESGQLTRVSKHNLDAVPSQAVMDDLSSRHTNIVGRVHRRSGSSLQTPGLGPIKGTVDILVRWMAFNISS